MRYRIGGGVLFDLLIQMKKNKPGKITEFYPRYQNAKIDFGQDPD